MSRNGWANDEAFFHTEKHVDGIVYGSKAVLLKLQSQLDSLYAGKKQEQPREKSSNFEMIKKQLLSHRDVSFDKSLLAALTKQEKEEVDQLLLTEILDHNPTCYPYVGCLNSVKKLDKAFLATLSGTEKYEVLMGIYLVTRRRRVLREIAAAAYQDIFCFDLLIDIYRETKENYILKIINRIYGQNAGQTAYDFVAGSKLHIDKNN